MKKYILLLVAAACMATSCTDFLKEKPMSIMSPEYYDTENGLDQLVIGCYKILRFKSEWENGALLFEINGDVAERENLNYNKYAPDVYQSSGAIATTANRLIGSDDSDPVMGAYPSINTCNLAIEKLESPDAPGKFKEDPAYRDQKKAEVLFCRAMAYYWLNTKFGDVPLILKSNISLPEKFFYKKATGEEIYKQIIEDLTWAVDKLPVTVKEQGRITKYAAAHMLAKFHLQRAQGFDFKNNAEPSLAMLYKGGIPSDDLQKAIDYATLVIDDFKGNAGTIDGLSNDYWNLFDVERGKPNTNENDPEIIYAVQENGKAQGRYGSRSQCYFTCNYTFGSSNITECYEYGKKNLGIKPTDFAYDVFTDKLNDTRFEKSFQQEYISNGKAYAESSARTWKTQVEVDYFNNNVYVNGDPKTPRQAVLKKPKFGKNERSFIFVENTPTTAVPYEEAMGQNHMLFVRWMRKTNGDLVYRVSADDEKNMGLDVGSLSIRLSSSKWVDPNRTAISTEQGTRSYIMIRLAETYLIRAEAYGRKDGESSANAIADINVLRARAARKTLEPAPDFFSYYGTVAGDPAQQITVDATYWDGASDKSAAEMYVSEANSNFKRFIHFIYNEYSREFNSEMNIVEGIHHAGIQAERIIGHNQMASNLRGNWPVAKNVTGGQGQDGNGKGSFAVYNTLVPWADDYLQLLTDESGKPLDDAAKRAYQNPGY